MHSNRKYKNLFANKWCMICRKYSSNKIVRCKYRHCINSRRSVGKSLFCKLPNLKRQNKLSEYKTYHLSSCRTPSWSRMMAVLFLNSIYFFMPVMFANLIPTINFNYVQIFRPHLVEIKSKMEAVSSRCPYLLCTV